MLESPQDKALQKCKENDLKPFLAVDVLDTASVFKKQRIVVLTDQKFEIFNKTGESKTHSYHWLELTECDMPDEEHLHLKFKRTNFNFSSPEIKRLVSGVIDTVQRYFTKGELKEMEFGLYFFRSTPTPISAYNRFAYALEQEKIEFEEEEEEENMDYFKYLFNSQKSIVNITDLPEYMDVAKVYIDTLPIMPFVQSVTIPETIDKKKDPYEFLIPFIKEPSYLRHMTIKGKLSESYVDFMEQLKDNNRSRLNGLTFENSDFTIDQLNLLSTVATTRKFTTLGFRNAISHSARIYFCSTFFAGNVSKTLKMLDLSGTKALDFRVLFQKIRSVVVLSIENCDTEIAEIVTALSMTSLPQLMVLNISGNPYNVPLPSSPNLPHNIRSLVANGITFPDNHLVTFITFLFSKYPKGIKLSLSNALASTDEWFRVFNFLANSNYNQLTALTWDSNPTYPSLFEFLARNQRLEYLSLCGCFFESNQAPISSLADFLETSRTLKYLILRGNKTSFLGKYTVAILTVIRNLSTLERFDISFNNGGDECFLALKILAQELEGLKLLSFDGNKPATKQPFLDLLDICKKKVTPIEVTFPENDIQFMQKRLILTDEEAQEQRNAALTKPKPCNIQKNKDYQRPTNSPLDDPCCLFVDYYTQEFPTFLTSEEIRDLGAVEKEDETYVPETVQLDYNVDDAPYEDNMDARTIASLNFPYSSRSTSDRRFNAPLSPSSLHSVRNINVNDDDSSMSKKRTVASLIRRAKSERAESYGEATPDSPVSQRSLSSKGKQSIKSSSLTNRSARKPQTKRIISPYHQGLTAENVERHSWEFPSNFEIHFNDNIWKKATTEFSIQRLYDDIRNEKGVASQRGERQSVSSKYSKRSK